MQPSKIAYDSSYSKRFQNLKSSNPKNSRFNERSYRNSDFIQLSMVKEAIHGACIKKRKKRRWTKEEKRVKHLESGEITRTTGGEKSKKQQFNERVLRIAEKFASNGKGVRILKRPMHQKSDRNESESESDTSLVVRTVSSSLLQHLGHDEGSTMPSLPASISIFTKPLLICDINGILCHRVRRDPYPDIKYRESTKKVSGTPIIPRPGLNEFLELLSQHFCLAIWTSAKPKSAQALVKAIVPSHIQLVFVWAQNQCHVQQSQDDEEDDLMDERNAVFVKSLSKVYTRYPLWNSTNTLLIDDSREKILPQDVGNLFQPPPMNGKQASELLSQRGILDDQENHERQMKLFGLLVEKVDSRDVNDQLSGKCSTMPTLLAEESKGHMLLETCQLHNANP